MTLPRNPSVVALVLLVTLCSCGRNDPSAASEERPEPRDEPTPTPTEVQDEPPQEEPARGPVDHRTVYVPAYSHISGPRGRPTLLSVTLSVRNVDPSATVTLTHVDYFDTSGHRVRRYLRGPRRLRPLETAEFSVETLDEVGGSGANFLVHWEGPQDAHPLLTETVMIGHAGAGYVSFTSRGVELDRPPDLALEEDEPGGGGTTNGVRP